MNSSCELIARGIVVTTTKRHSSALKSMPSKRPPTNRCPLGDALKWSISAPKAVKIQVGYAVSPLRLSHSETLLENFVASDSLEQSQTLICWPLGSIREPDPI